MMSQATTNDKATGLTAVRAAFGLLTAAAYFVGLNFALTGPDEPRYAQIGREMLERGDWITPTLGGHPWFEKPVLLYWFEIISYKIFGVNETAARLGPALCGFGIVVALYLIGKSSGDRRAGAWFALIGASTLGVLVFAHAASFDIVLTFTLTAALAAFWRFEQEERSILPLILFYVLIGTALLAKGLVGIILPAGILGCYHIFARKLPSRRLLNSVLWGSVIVAVVAGIWYLPMYGRHGWLFIDEFFIQHHFQRFTSNKYQHPQPFYFFLWVLPAMTLPWLPFFLAGAWNAVRSALTPRSGTGCSSVSLRLFALSWVVVPLTFFSLSGSKLPAYVLPAVPGAAILAAGVVMSLIDRSRGWRVLAAAVAGVVLVAAIVLGVMVVPNYAADDSVKPLMNVANGQGYGDTPVLMLNTVSHSAEFYAAGRLERDNDGQLVRHDSPTEIASYLHASKDRTALVLVPTNFLPGLMNEPGIVSRRLSNNRYLTIVAVSAP